MEISLEPPQPSITVFENKIYQEYIYLEYVGEYSREHSSNKWRG